MKCDQCKKWYTNGVSPYGICEETEDKEVVYNEEKEEYECNQFKQ